MGVSLIFNYSDRDNDLEILLGATTTASSSFMCNLLLIILESIRNTFLYTLDDGRISFEHHQCTAFGTQDSNFITLNRDCVYAMKGSGTRIKHCGTS